jgi:hypothetical protein
MGDVTNAMHAFLCHFQNIDILGDWIFIQNQYVVHAHLTLPSPITSGRHDLFSFQSMIEKEIQILHSGPGLSDISQPSRAFQIGSIETAFAGKPNQKHGNEKIS